MFSDSNGAGNSKEQTEPRLACEKSEVFLPPQTCDDV